MSDSTVRRRTGEKSRVAAGGACGERSTACVHGTERTGSGSFLPGCASLPRWVLVCPYSSLMFGSYRKRRETGMRQRMQVPHGGRTATHTGPESCTVAGNGGGEALTGGGVGRVLSRENTVTGGPRSWYEAEGNTGRTAMARCVRPPRGRRPCACAQASCTGTGRARQWPWGDGPWVRAHLGDRGR